MKILVIAAMQKELDLILNELDGYRFVDLSDIKFYEGKIGSNDIFVSQCGIGKVNAALRTERLINKIHPDLIINSGVAGGLDETMKIGQVLVADKVCYHDVWCGPGTKYGQADEMPLYYIPSEPVMNAMNEVEKENPDVYRHGLLCSGDKFISTPEQVAVIKSHFPDALGCDMESAAIAQTCCLNDVPFMIIRVMSDRPGGGENLSEYTNFWTDAPKQTFKALSSLINRLN